MNITEKNVIREIKVFATEDGMEFSTLEEANRHQRELERKRLDYLLKYVEEHAVYYACDEWYGLGGYVGGEGETIYLVKVDETVIEFAEAYDCDNEFCEDDIGEIVFFGLSGSGELWYRGTLDNIIDDMENDLESLKRMKEESK